MNGHGELIDRIVREVLSQLSSRPETVRTNGADNSHAQTIIKDRVITAELLTQRLNGAATVIIGQKAIVTPSAWDLARSRNLTIQRDHEKQPSGERTDAYASDVRLIVVNATPAVDRVVADSGATATTTDCPDNAAEMAAEAAKDRKAPVVVFAAWSHRAAMLANRHDKVRAAAIDGASQVRTIAKQMRPNVWCIDPRPLSYFELKNLIGTVQKS